MKRDEVSRIEAAVRDANPVPHLDDLIDSDVAAAVTLLVEQRTRTMANGPTRPALQPTGPQWHRRWSMVWAFVAGFVAILLVVGVAAWFLRGGETSVADEPPAPSTLVEEADDPISVDSLIWSRIALGPGGPSIAVAAGDRGLVGVGGYSVVDPDDLTDGGGGPGWVQGYMDVPTVWTSPDGYGWSQVTGEEEVFGIDGEISDIAAGSEGFVAVAERYVWTSPDGLTWSKIIDDAFRDSDDLRGVIAGGPGFVAFGEDGPSNRAAIWTSPDGYVWTRAPDDPAVFDRNANMLAMTVGGPGLVAVGFDEERSNPVVWTSPDGYTWTRVPHDPAAFGEGTRMDDVVVGKPGIIAVGSAVVSAGLGDYEDYESVAAVWSSPDGLTWTQIPHDPAAFEGPADMPYGEMTSVAAVGDGFIAVGTNGGGASAWTSHDGFNWIRITDDLNITDNAGMEQVIAGGPGAIILGAELIEDYRDNRPPLIETVIWIGNPSTPPS